MMDFGVESRAARLFDPILALFAPQKSYENENITRQASERSVADKKMSKIEIMKLYCLTL